MKKQPKSVRPDNLRISRLYINLKDDDATPHLCIQAIAEVDYRISSASGDRRIQFFQSGGLYGIDPANAKNRDTLVSALSRTLSDVALPKPD